MTLKEVKSKETITLYAETEISHGKKTFLMIVPIDTSFAVFSNSFQCHRRRLYPNETPLYKPLHLSKEKKNSSTGEIIDLSNHYSIGEVFENYDTIFVKGNDVEPVPSQKKRKATCDINVENQKRMTLSDSDLSTDPL